MEEQMDRVFLEYSTLKLEQLVDRIRDCAGRLNHEQLWRRGGENQNAVGNLLLHLAGNVRQWIVSGVGGAPDARFRDREFAAREEGSGGELMNRLEQTVREATAVLRGIGGKRLMERVRIQSYELTVLEAVYHVVEHFAEHTGQIIFAARLLTGEDPGYYRHLNAPAHQEKTP